MRNMDNRTLQLGLNEHIVYSEGESPVEINNEEFKFFISNVSLIFVKEITYLFKKSTFEVIKWPIKKIKLKVDIPQVKVEHGEYKTWNIVIYFNRGVKKIEFYYESRLKKSFKKKHVEQIANIISNLRTKAISDLKSKYNEKAAITRVENINKEIIKPMHSAQSNPKSKDDELLRKKGFMSYEVVIAPDERYYIDYRVQKFAIKNFSGLRIMKFKDFKSYSIDYDNPKSSTSVHFGGGAFEGALTGSFLTKSLIGKSAAKVGAIAGGVAKSIANTHIDFGGKLAARIAIRYRTHNQTIELSDFTSLEAYRPLFDMLDKISDLNKSKRV